MAAGYSFASMACKSDELLLGALSTVYKTRAAAAAASGNQKNRFSLDANKNLFKWRLLTMHQPRQQVPPFWFFLSFSLSSSSSPFSFLWTFLYIIWRLRMSARSYRLAASALVYTTHRRISTRTGRRVAPMVLKDTIPLASIDRILYQSICHLR